MKSLMLSLLLLPGLAAAAEPLRPMQACLDPTRARAWHPIDSDELLVDAGRQRFHLRVAPSCPELGVSNEIAFRTATGVGRICGNAGDTVLVPRRSPVHFPCRIVEITPLSKEEYAARLGDKAKDAPRGVVEVREDAAQR